MDISDEEFMKHQQYANKNSIQFKSVSTRKKFIKDQEAIVKSKKLVKDDILYAYNLIVTNNYFYVLPTENIAVQMIVNYFINMYKFAADKKSSLLTDSKSDKIYHNEILKLFFSVSAAKENKIVEFRQSDLYTSKKYHEIININIKTFDGYNEDDIINTSQESDDHTDTEFDMNDWLQSQQQTNFINSQSLTLNTSQNNIILDTNEISTSAPNTNINTNINTNTNTGITNINNTNTNTNINIISDKTESENDNQPKLSFPVKPKIILFDKQTVLENLFDIFNKNNIKLYICDTLKSKWDGKYYSMNKNIANILLTRFKFYLAAINDQKEFILQFYEFYLYFYNHYYDLVFNMFIDIDKLINSSKNSRSICTLKIIANMNERIRNLNIIFAKHILIHGYPLQLLFSIASPQFFIKNYNQHVSLLDLMYSISNKLKTDYVKYNNSSFFHTRIVYYIHSAYKQLCKDNYFDKNNHLIKSPLKILNIYNEPINSFCNYVKLSSKDLKQLAYPGIFKRKHIESIVDDDIDYLEDIDLDLDDDFKVNKRFKDINSNCISNNNYDNELIHSEIKNLKDQMHCVINGNNSVIDLTERPDNYLHRVQDDRLCKIIVDKGAAKEAQLVLGKLIKNNNSNLNQSDVNELKAAINGHSKLSNTKLIKQLESMYKYLYTYIFPPFLPVYSKTF